MPASRNPIPPRLTDKISPGLLLFTGAGKVFAKLFGIGLAAFGLFGTVVLHDAEVPHHSGILYFFGPWVFPSLIALCYTLSPFRPYRGVVYMEKTRDVDTSDPVVIRLLELFKSKESHRHIWRFALTLSLTLFSVMSVAAIRVGRSLTWSLSLIDLGGGALALVGCFIASSAEYIGWGLTTWVSREAAHEEGGWRRD